MLLHNPGQLLLVWAGPAFLGATQHAGQGPGVVLIGAEQAVPLALRLGAGGGDVGFLGELFAGFW